MPSLIQCQDVESKTKKARSGPVPFSEKGLLSDTQPEQEPVLYCFCTEENWVEPLEAGSAVSNCSRLRPNLQSWPGRCSQRQTCIMPTQMSALHCSAPNYSALLCFYFLLACNGLCYSGSALPRFLSNGVLHQM